MNTQLKDFLLNYYHQKNRFVCSKQGYSQTRCKKINSAKLPVLFDKRISRSLLSSFASAISGSAFSRGTTFLKNKLNERIFSDDIYIYDDPLIESGLGSQHFDSEGVASNKIELVKKES